jgi:hypothetical protein
MTECEAAETEVQAMLSSAQNTIQWPASRVYRLNHKSINGE